MYDNVGMQQVPMEYGLMLTKSGLTQDLTTSFYGFTSGLKLARRTFPESWTFKTPCATYQALFLQGLDVVPRR